MTIITNRYQIDEVRLGVVNTSYNFRIGTAGPSFLLLPVRLIPSRSLRLRVLEMLDRWMLVDYYEIFEVLINMGRLLLLQPSWRVLPVLLPLHNCCLYLHGFCPHCFRCSHISPEDVYLGIWTIRRFPRRHVGHLTFADDDLAVWRRNDCIRPLIGIGLISKCNR